MTSTNHPDDCAKSSLCRTPRRPSPPHDALQEKELMQIHTLKAFLGTGLAEAAVVTGGLLILGHCQGVIHASPNISPVAAVQSGDYDSLRTLLQRGADPNAKDASGTPLLMRAVLYADVNTVRLLLNNGADPNATNAAGATALVWAAGDPEKAHLLLDYGADPNAKSALGRTPLLAAAAVDGAGSVVRRLIENGADTTAQDVLKGTPVLMTGGGSAPAIVEAAKARDGEALRAILARPGVDLAVQDANGGTALTEAVINGNHDNARLLLAAGASVEQTVASKRYTPLMLAAMTGDDRMIAMLLEASPDVNAADSLGTTALMWAAYAADHGHSAAVDLLLRAGADPSIENRRGESALTMAGWHGRTPTVHKLMHNQ
jgi:ankyrin repeat protein